MRSLFIALVLIVLTITILVFGCMQKPADTSSDEVSDEVSDKVEGVEGEFDSMKLTSTAFQNGGSIPKEFTCDGPGISPPLTINDVPAGAKSLVLIMDDPDVPKHLRADGMWDHWVVFNIPPNTKEIPKGQEPQGVHGTGTGGNKKYHGPCPPDREHRYFFKLSALDTTLNLQEGATKAQVEKAMQGHILAKAELMGRYERS